MALGTPWVANPEAMLASMPGRVWKRWQVFYRLFPFGPQQDDLRAGMICSMLGDGKAKPGDFFASQAGPEVAEPEDDPLAQQLLARAFASRAGGEVVGEDGAPATTCPS